MLGSVYVIQKVLQRHKFIILVAEWKVSGKTELNSASPQTRKCQNTKFDLSPVFFPAPRSQGWF